MPALSNIDWEALEMEFYSDEECPTVTSFFKKKGITENNRNFLYAKEWKKKKQKIKKAITTIVVDKAQELYRTDETALVLSEQWKSSLERAVHARIECVRELSDRVLLQNKPKKLKIANLMKDAYGHVTGSEIVEVDALYPMLSSQELIEIVKFLKLEISEPESLMTQSDKVAVDDFLQKLRDAEKIE